MALSPHEEKVLATLERELRTEDPALAAVLSRALPSSFPAHPFLLPIRHVLCLTAALVCLIAVGAFFGDQLGVLGMGALTYVAVVPWLVGAARSAGRRRSTAAEPGTQRNTARRRVGGALPLAVLLIVVALALVSPAVAAGLLLALAVMMLPWIVVRLVEWVERRGGPV